MYRQEEKRGKGNEFEGLGELDKEKQRAASEAEQARVCECVCSVCAKSCMCRPSLE